MTAIASVLEDPVILPVYTVPSKVVCRIRQIVPEEFPTVINVLQLWRSIYKGLPSDIAVGGYISELMLYRVSTGFMIVAEDATGCSHAFARALMVRDHLSVEELVVAPWNNFEVHQAIKDDRSFFEEDALLEIAKIYKLSPSPSFVFYTKGIGTLMLYYLAKIALENAKSELVLSPRRESATFYLKLGMESVDEKLYFFFFKEGIPKKLTAKIKEYFNLSDL